MTHEGKVILDACCGARKFWFNKQHPAVLYQDKRVLEKGDFEPVPKLEIKPDVVEDYRNMPYPDKSFKLVIFDPPHMIRTPSPRSIMQAMYGTLSKEEWAQNLLEGFNECWRVLEDFGVLVFKWNEESVSINTLIELLPREPLVGQRNTTVGKTHWLVFMKGV